MTIYIITHKIINKMPFHDHQTPCTKSGHPLGRNFIFLIEQSLGPQNVKGWELVTSRANDASLVSTISMHKGWEDSRVNHSFNRISQNHFSTGSKEFLLF